MTTDPAQHPQQSGTPTGGPEAHAGLEQEMRALLGPSIAAFASLTGPRHVVEAANATFFAAVGGEQRVRVGRPVGESMPELAEQGLARLSGPRHALGL